MNKPAPRRQQGANPSVQSPPAGYAGRTRYTLLEYEALLANASIGIAFTRERRFFLCNPKFAEMFGWGPEELIGQPGEVVYPSRESYAALGQIAAPALSAGKQLDLEWEMRRKDGSTFLARVVAKAIDAKNTQQGTVWIVEDITERRRQADEVTRLLREQDAILGNASIGIVFVKERHIVRCNRRYEEMYGYAPGEMDGKPMSIVYLDQDVVRLNQAYEVLGRGETSRRVELRRRKDGSTLWIRADGRAVDPQEPHQGSVWIVEDVTEQRGAEERVQRALAEQELILDNATVGIAFVRNRVIQRCNPFLESMLGAPGGSLVGQLASTLFSSHEEWSTAVRRAYDQTEPGGQHVAELRLRRADGSSFLCAMRGRRIDGGGAEQEWIWSYQDVTAEREAEQRVQRALAEQELILDNATVGIAFVRNRAIQRCNRFLEEMVGTGPGDLVGQSTALLFASAQEWKEAGERSRGTVPGGTFAGEARFARRDGTSFVCHARGRRIDAGGDEEEWIWSYEDITAEREAELRVQRALGELERAVVERTAELQKSQARAQHLADHDALTGLPNRRLLEDRLTQALALSQRNRQNTAVMFVDLDRFKAVNDSLGHAVGDALLKEVTQRLVNQLRVGDTVCRIGGDEFVVVLPEVKRSSDVAQVAQKVIEQLSQPFAAEGRELVVTASIGIAVYPEDGADAETLIRNADAAMYHAKELGRASYQFFTEQMNQTASRRLALESDLRRALGKEELRLHYQPIVEAAGGKLAGYEALVRWEHPQRGLVLPGEFIPLAEETGLILRIGEWVLREACRWAKHRGEGQRGLPVAVNLSPRQFNDPKLAQSVAQVLADSGLKPGLLELEITETTAMQHTDTTLGTLKKLKKLGVSIVIDDFGTGYSSLAYLRRFPVDKLKIDRAFVAEAPQDKDQAAIVSAIVALAHALHIRTVAEGVETQAQHDFLARCGCDFIQGYLVGRPAAL